MSSLTQVLSTFWNDYYNTDDSYLPIIVPSSMWFTCWVMCGICHINYGKFNAIHLFHHIVAMTIGGISLYYHDDTILKERISIFFSLSYFVFDLLDCIIRYDVNYAIHATLCLCLGYYNYTHPILFATRSNSRAAFIELSTPIFQLVQYKRTPILFVLFAITFTCCRIIWVPCIAYHIHQHGVQYNELPMILLGGFYCLNWFWYSKILRILYTGDVDKGKKKKKEE